VIYFRQRPVSDSCEVVPGDNKLPAFWLRLQPLSRTI